MADKHYDIVVIGGGAGIKVAEAAAKAGKSTALVDRGPLGGTCVNRGCVPSKMLIYPADLVHHIDKADRLSVDVGEASLVWDKLVQRVTSAVEASAGRIEDATAEIEGLDRYRCHAEFVDAQRLKVGDAHITADRWIIASGVRPFIPEVAGLRDVPFMTSTDALRRQDLPKHLLIMGGGYIAAEMAHLYSTAGAEVTIVVRSKVLRHEDEDIRNEFLKEFRKRVNVVEGTTIDKVSYVDGAFTLDGGSSTFTGDALLVATGTQANADTLKIDKLGAATNESKYLKVDEFLRVEGCDNVFWALGDAVGPPFFRHTANKEARYLVASLITGRTSEPFVMPPVPSAVFTHPQIASVGKTEQQLKDDGVAYKTAQLKYDEVSMGRARGCTNGLFKLLATADAHTIVGAHACGEEACELIHLSIAAITHKWTASQLLEMTFIHPTLHELVAAAARRIEGVA